MARHFTTKDIRTAMRTWVSPPVTSPQGYKLYRARAVTVKIPTGPNWPEREAEAEPVLCRWSRCRKVQPLWETVWSFLQNKHTLTT